MKKYSALIGFVFFVCCVGTDTQKQKIIIPKSCQKVYNDFLKYEVLKNDISTSWYLSVADSIVKKQIADTVLCDCYLYGLAKHAYIGDHSLFFEAWLNKMLSDKTKNRMLIYKVISSLGFSNYSLVLRGRDVLKEMTKGELLQIATELQRKALISMQKKDVYSNEYTYQLLFYQYIRQTKQLSVFQEKQLIGLANATE